MTVRPEKSSTRSTVRGTRAAPPARARGVGPRMARYATAVLVAVTLCLALVGGFAAFRLVVDDAGASAADGLVSTSFGVLRVDSFGEVVRPQMVRKGHIGMPVEGDPDKVSLEVAVTLANTTATQVELTPADFALRLEPDPAPIPVEGASFESVRLLPGAAFDARIQFPVTGGEHRLSLLFDDPGGSGAVLVDLGRARFQEPAASNKDQ